MRAEAGSDAAGVDFARRLLTQLATMELAEMVVWLPSLASASLRQCSQRGTAFQLGAWQHAAEVRGRLVEAGALNELGVYAYAHALAEFSIAGGLGENDTSNESALAWTSMHILGAWLVLAEVKGWHAPAWGGLHGE